MHTDYQACAAMLTMDPEKIDGDLFTGVIALTYVNVNRPSCPFNFGSTCLSLFPCITSAQERHYLSLNRPQTTPWYISAKSSASTVEIRSRAPENPGALGASHPPPNSNCRLRSSLFVMNMYARLTYCVNYRSSYLSKTSKKSPHGIT